MLVGNMVLQTHVTVKAASDYIVKQIGASNDENTLNTNDEISGGGIWGVTSSYKDFDSSNSLWSADIEPGNTFIQYTPKSKDEGGLQPGYYKVQFYNPAEKRGDTDSEMRWEIAYSSDEQGITYNCTTLDGIYSYSNVKTSVTSNTSYYTEEIDKYIIIKDDQSSSANLVFDASQGNAVTVRIVATAERLDEYSFQFSSDGENWIEDDSGSQWEILHIITGSRAARKIKLDIPEGMNYFRITMGGTAPAHEYRISEVFIEGVISQKLDNITIDQRNKSQGWVDISSKIYYFSGNGTEYIKFTRTKEHNQRYSRLGSVRFVWQKPVLSEPTLIYDDNQQPVEGALMADRDVTAKATLLENSGDIALIAVVYNTVDKTVEKVAINEVKGAEVNSDIEVRFRLPEVVDNRVVKVFIWDGINSMKPLKDSTAIFGE